MASPKSIPGRQAVQPASVKKPAEADDAITGSRAALQARQANRRKPQQAVFKGKQKSEREEDKEETTDIKIKLVDQDDNPVPGEAYRIVLPNKEVDESTLDENGCKVLAGIPKDQEGKMCKISFPNLDKEVWEKI